MERGPATDGRHALAEERSIELHRVVADRLRHDERLLERALERVRGWLQDRAVAEPYARAWLEVLGRPADEVAALLVDTSERARALRQTSPFAGVLDARTRWEVWRRVAERVGSA
jgi:hypothetical protein